MRSASSSSSSRPSHPSARSTSTSTRRSLEPGARLSSKTSSRIRTMTHLGKVITYAAGKRAEVVIWLVAARATSTGRRSSGSTSTIYQQLVFFLVEIELYSSATRCLRRASTSLNSQTSGRRPSNLASAFWRPERTVVNWTKYREVAQVPFEFLKVFQPAEAFEDWLDDAALRNIVLSARGCSSIRSAAASALSSTCRTIKRSVARLSRTRHCSRGTGLHSLSMPRKHPGCDSQGRLQDQGQPRCLAALIAQQLRWSGDEEDCRRIGAVGDDGPDLAEPF